MELLLRLHIDKGNRYIEISQFNIKMVPPAIDAKKLNFNEKIVIKVHCETTNNSVNN